MRKIYSLLIVIFLFTTGCGGQSLRQEIEEKTEEGKMRVGFSQMENNSPWRIAETNSIKSEAEKRGIELIFMDAEGDVEKQINDIKYLIDQKVDYIILAPKLYEEFGEALRLAKEAKIPLILLDRKAKGEPGEDYLTLIASDFIWQGQQAANILVEAANEEAYIVELTGTEGSSAAIDRAKGFREIIDQYENMTIIASESAEFNRADGKRVMESIIRYREKKITAVYAHNDEMAIGAIQALKAAGMHPGQDVVIVSIDGEKDALKAIIANELYASIECNPFMGPVTFDVIERHQKGEEIAPHIVSEDRIYTIENAIRYVDSAY